jgi:hypothetical protein
MPQFFLTSDVVDLVLAFVVLEGLALAAYRGRTGRGLAGVDILTMLLPGAFLLLGWRFAVVQAHWAWIAACVVSSLVLHLADLTRRWRR